MVIFKEKDSSNFGLRLKARSAFFSFFYALCFLCFLYILILQNTALLAI